MQKEVLLKEIQFKALRSSGAGGQHVNKVSSKVELSFDLVRSLGLSEKEKDRVREKLENRLTKDQLLILQCDEARSQHRNKQLVINRFFDLLKGALHVPKKRKPTTPSRSSKEKRLKSKKVTSSKKVNRQKPEME